MLRGTNILVVSDEVYEHMVFDGEVHQSVVRFPELAERSYVVSSFGTTYHVTGGRSAMSRPPKRSCSNSARRTSSTCFV